MSFASRSLTPLVLTVCEAIDSHAEELTDLDRAIGDADHGLNMQRGFGAIKKEVTRLAAMAPGAAIAEAGKILVMTVGGASGPLYGTLFMRLGQELSKSGDEVSLMQLRAALDAAIAAVMARGKAHPGQKTLIDVLVPLQTELQRATGTSFDAIRQTVAKAADATVALKAERGRASFLGERSVGHMDPGARSMALIVTAVCEVLENANRATQTTE